MLARQEAVQCTHPLRVQVASLLGANQNAVAHIHALMARIEALEGQVQLLLAARFTWCVVRGVLAACAMLSPVR